jgi:hypothetical protein
VTAAEAEVSDDCAMRSLSTPTEVTCAGKRGGQGRGGGSDRRRAGWCRAGSSGRRSLRGGAAQRSGQARGRMGDVGQRSAARGAGEGWLLTHPVEHGGALLRKHPAGHEAQQVLGRLCGGRGGGTGAA